MKKITTVILGALVMSLAFSQNGVNAQTVDQPDLPELKADVLVVNVDNDTKVKAVVVKNVKATRAAFRITYDGNGATSGTPLVDEEVYDGTTEAPILIPGDLAKTGFTFDGWTIAQDGSGHVYRPNGEFITITTNTTLYAKWIPDAPTANEFRVTYDGNGSTAGAVPTDNTVYTGTEEATVLDKATLVKTGFTFDGWNTKADGTGTSYAANAKFVVNANTTLFAKWTADAPTADEFRVTYDGNGSTAGAVPTDNTVYTGTEEATVLDKATLVKTGFTFAGWNTKADGTGTNYAAGAKFVVSANTTLFAKWTADAPVADEFRVTYDGNGSTAGAVLVDDTVYNGTEEAVVLIPGTLEKTGFTFVEWNTKADGTGIGYGPGDNFIVSANTTLYAQWKADGVVTVVEENKNTTTTKTATKKETKLPTTGSNELVYAQGLASLLAIALVARFRIKNN